MLVKALILYLVIYNITTLMCLHHHVQSYVTSCNSVKDNIVCGNICDLMFIGDRHLTRFCSSEINEMLEYLCTS